MKNTPFQIARSGWANISLRAIGSSLYYRFRSFQERRHSSDLSLAYEWEELNFSRTALLNYIIANHSKGFNLKYLEIGCASNLNFNSIMVSNKTGVDPDQGGNVRLTSDEFFSSQNNNFDVVFIDGLHTYGQVKKDFVNALKTLNAGGVIILDDMIPRNWKEHQTPRVQTRWNGDVWKLLFDLKKLDCIEFKVILIDSGQCVVFPTGDVALEEEFFSKDLDNEQFNYFHENINHIPKLELNEGLEWIEEILNR